MNYRIKSVEPLRYPVLRVTFDDGLTGEYDLRTSIETAPMLAPLEDESYFGKVAVAPHGNSFGWNLDQPGHEIDFCPDAVRIAVETEIVEQLAADYRAHRSAAD
jgi:hypothetical protein